MTSYIVYSNEAGEGKIKVYVEKVLTVLKQYNINVKFTTLSDWHKNICSNSAVEADKTTVVYIASIDDEDFHTKVKPVFLHGLPNSMVVLLYNPVDENHVKKFKASVKSSLKKKYPTKVKETIDRIVGVNDLENMSQWWPQVLKLLVRTRVASNGRPARENGVFFKIDVDDETQVEWLEWQRNTLEKTFKVTCRQGDGILSEETYIKNSQCVIMYVDRKLYQGLRTDTARKEGKKKMLEAIKETRDMCKRHGTMFQVFVDEAGVKLTNTLASDYGMTMIGDGMLSYWLGLLSVLNLVGVRRMPDTWFYSMKDRHARDVFKAEKYPHLFRSALSPREGIHRVASPSSIEAQTLRHAGSVKAVSYQSTDSVVLELDNTIPRQSAVCCNLLNILQPRSS